MLNSFQLSFFDKQLFTSRKNRICKEWTENRYISGFVLTWHSYSFLKNELYSPFLWIEFKYLNPVQPFQRESLLLSTKPLGVPGTHLIDLTIKPPRGFEAANPGLVIGKHLIVSLLLYSNNEWCIKDLRYKLNMINKTFLYPMRTLTTSKGYIMSRNGVLTCPLPFQ